MKLNVKQSPQLCNMNECTGCTACMAVCPVNAINMQNNESFFLYPCVDKEKCIQCGACELVVRTLNSHMEKDIHKRFPIQYYATRLLDAEERMCSQSGGLFYALATAIIRNDGIVCGCVYDDKIRVVHTMATTIEQLQRMRGSKYVQSDMGDCYRQIGEYLKDGKEVLFSGTPCQCAGMEAYLERKGISKEKFYSCDFICHGVPSPGVFSKYLKFLEKKYKGKIKSINLRDKTVSWRRHVERLEFDKGTYEGGLFVELFYTNFIIRKSCETCKYTSLNRPSDITIGDCWGIEKTHPELWNDDTGISVALLQTEKGKLLFERGMEWLDVVELPSYTQPQLEYPSAVPKQKDNFWRDYQNMSFERLLKKYTSYGGIKLKLKRKILRLMRKW